MLIAERIARRKLLENIHIARLDVCVLFEPVDQAGE